MRSGIHPSLELGAGSEEDASVGAYLRSRRLRQGEELQHIADVLRIKYDYLLAIEDGRLEDLPGPIYSTGFIRTYSEYLGLDGEEIIQRLKSEVTVLAESPKLVFPAIIPEDGIPGGAIVIVGLLIACIGYFTWYWTASSDRFVAESVPTIPKELVQLSDKNPKNSPQSENNSLVEASSAVAAPAKMQLKSNQNDLELGSLLDKVENSTKSNQTSEKIVKAPEAPKTLGSEFAPIETSRQSNKLVLKEPRSLNPLGKIGEEKEKLSNISQLESQFIGTNTTTEGPVTIQKANRIAITQKLDKSSLREIVANDATNYRAPTSSNSLAKPNPVQATFDDNAPDTLSTLPDRVPVEVAALTDATSSSNNTIQTAKPAINKKQTLELNKDSRIRIIALNTSWIQLRDFKENRIILSKVLPKGQSYKVPNNMRLTLMTGNAGALKITVDGKTVPNIGKLGEVRRKVLLEVESLKSGRAVVE